MFAYDHHRISDRIGKKLPPGVSVSKLTTKNKKKEYAVTLSRRVEIRYLSRANVRKLLSIRLRPGLALCFVGPRAAIEL
jgi:hypothetical protein